MTDKELIQALRHCASDDEYDCLSCPGEATCDECSGKSLMDAADRLEALLAENEHLREVTKMMPRWVSVKEQLPAADVTPVRPELREAVELLEKNYEQGLNSEFVRNPLAWALHQTWGTYDRKCRQWRMKDG